MKVRMRRVISKLGSFSRNQFTRNVGTTLVAQGSSLVFSLVNAAFLARYLGPEGKGILALAIMVPTMLGLVLSGGVGIANVYFVGSGRVGLQEASAASVTFAMLATGVGAVSTVVLYVTGWLHAAVPGVPATLQLAAMVLLPLSLLDGYFNTLLMGLQRIFTVNVIMAVRGVTGVLAAFLLLVVWQWGLVGGLLASVVATTLAVLAKGIVLRRLGATFRPRWNPRIMRRMFGFGMKGQIGNILQFFNYRLDTFILNFFRGSSAVGIYGAAVALAELLWQLPNAIGFVIFPKAAASKASAMNAFTPRVFKITLVLTTAGGVILAFTGRTLIELVYSPTFAEAYGPLLALLPGVVLLGAGKVLANEMAGRGYPHYNSAVSSTVLVLTVGLDFVLIPRAGAVGAAVASSIAYGASFLLSVVLYVLVYRKSAKVSEASSEGVSASS